MADGLIRRALHRSGPSRDPRPRGRGASHPGLRAVPDQLYARADQLSDRGAERAAVLVVEILSPGDETYDKLAWYAAGGVDEVLVVDPRSLRAEVFARRGNHMVLV